MMSNVISTKHRMDNRIGKESDGSSLSTQDKTLRFSFLIQNYVTFTTEKEKTKKTMDMKKDDNKMVGRYISKNVKDTQKITVSNVKSHEQKSAIAHLRPI